MNADRTLLTAALSKLPDSMFPDVTESPRTGSGVHRWLCSTAFKLKQYLAPPSIRVVLRHGVRNCGRSVPQSEIDEAVNFATKSIASPSPAGGMRFAFSPSPMRRGLSWPRVDEVLRRDLIRKCPFSVDLLRKFTPDAIDGKDAGYFIDHLFPGDPLLCCGISPKEFRTKPKSGWGVELGGLSLIVPSPMTATVGLNKKGRFSERCLANTGQRKYLVVEFDQGTLDEQASLILDLKQTRSMVMVVYSGGKSLHAWFSAGNDKESVLKAWFTRAVKLGADPQMWCRAQMARMPQGVRFNGSQRLPQSVVWFSKGGSPS